MLASSASQQASQLRSRILESAFRIIADAAPKRPPRKRSIAATPRKKRPAAVAFDFVTESADQVGAENASSARSTKVARLRKGSDGGQPLLPASSAKMNSLPSYQQIPSTEEPTEALRLSITPPPPPKHNPAPGAPRKADTWPVDPATNYQIEHPVRIEAETRAWESSPHESRALARSLRPHTGEREVAQSLLPTSSALSSSIDGVDYLLDESFFRELLNPSSPASTTHPETKLAAISQPHDTPVKMDPVRLLHDIPTPPSLTSDAAPSPHSATMTPPTPSRILKPFMRQAPAAQSFARLQQLPSLKAEHRIITCFRIAEVLRLQSTLSESAPLAGVTIELYAKVTSISRNGATQHLQLADLFFPDRPPYLDATCELGEEGTIFDDDVRNLTTPKPTAAGMKSNAFRNRKMGSKLCRTIVQVKQKQVAASSPRKQAADVKVLSIWETDWEDVERVRGIVDPQYQTPGLPVGVLGQAVQTGNSPMKKGAGGGVQIVGSTGMEWTTSMV